jgi:hypothetical protein
VSKALKARSSLAGPCSYRQSIVLNSCFCASTAARLLCCSLADKLMSVSACPLLDLSLCCLSSLLGLIRSLCDTQLDGGDGHGGGMMQRLMGRMQGWMLGVIRRHGFLGILLLASWPNAAFDLCGICCGHFQMPFWQFFGATLIGKALVKVPTRQPSFLFACIPHHDFTKASQTSGPHLAI